MLFVMIFLILYGIGFGVCYIAANTLLNGSDTVIVKNAAFVPVLNVIVSILIVFFIFYLVRDYRRNMKKIEDKKPETAQN